MEPGIGDSDEVDDVDDDVDEYDDDDDDGDDKVKPEEDTQRQGQLLDDDPWKVAKELNLQIKIYYFYIKCLIYRNHKLCSQLKQITLIFAFIFWN